MKKRILILLSFTLSFLLISCSGNGLNYETVYHEKDITEDEHQPIVENPFIKTAINNKSNISLSANTAAYSFVRSQINEGRSVDRDAVRIEEFVNFFNYDYNQPNSGDVFGLKAQLLKTPWNNETNLLLIGLETEKVDLGDVANNLVILVDVSGSMAADNKLPLVKQSIKLLVEQMKENDIISLVTYSSGEKVEFKGKTNLDITNINKTIDQLKASGATNGKRGLQMAYQVAEEFYIEEGNNRIILATDGDFNLGISSTPELVEYISEKRETGIYFSAFGFGYGNFKDEKLEQLAKAGNGVYHYIDDLLSARKAFIDNIDGLLYTVARDAKAQIEFNTANILEYRLIGYENRTLTNTEFEDDQTDAGEIGTGLQVTAIYEVILNEENITDDLANLTIRYKSNNILDELVYEDNFSLDSTIITNTPSSDSIFISAVVEFGLILLNSAYKAEANLPDIIERLESDLYNQEDYYRSDFIELVKKYQLFIE